VRKCKGKYDKKSEIDYNTYMPLNFHTSNREYQFLPKEIDTKQRSMVVQKMDPLQIRIDTITRKILQHNSTLSGYRFFIFQSNDNQVLHTKDKRIFIPTGLIRITSNDDQLAFILSHEIAHWENEDIIENQVPIDPTNNEQYLAECHADKKAIQYIEQSGYNKERVETMLQRLEKRGMRQKYECD